MTCTEGGVELEVVHVVKERGAHRKEDVLKIDALLCDDYMYVNFYINNQ